MLGSASAALMSRARSSGLESSCRVVGSSTGSRPGTSLSRRIACSCTARANPGAADEGGATAILAIARTHGFLGGWTCPPVMDLLKQARPCARGNLRCYWRCELAAVSATSARTNLYRLIDQVNKESQPLTITGQRGNAVLIGEADWQAMRETLFLERSMG